MTDPAMHDSDVLDTEVLVVGGGPAGSAAAITLARAGRQVTLVDRARFPRDKTCGDGLTTGALRELEALGLDPSDVPSWRRIDHVMLAGPSHRPVPLPLPTSAGQFGAVARRAELDAAVLDLVRRSGAEVREETALSTATLRSGGVDVGFDDGSAAQARWLVAADGMWSPTRKALSLALPRYRGEWHALRQYMTGVGPDAAEHLHVWFEPDILPGYVWSFPLGDGTANVGFGLRRDAGWNIGAMGVLWREILERPWIREVLGPDARATTPPRAWPIPARVDRIPLAAGRALIVGDAAAATDPMTGEGIGQALATGRWAAEAVLAGGGGQAVRTAYEDRVRRNLAVDHRLADRLADALSHRKGARIAIRLAGATPWTRRNFARWLFEDYPRALVGTPRRWRPGALGGRGSFVDEPA
jgi:geranylgeranyl reductase family protein